MSKFFSGILILVNSSKQQEQKYKITLLDLDLFSVPKEKKMHQGCRHMKTCQSDVIALQEKHFTGK